MRIIQEEVLIQTEKASDFKPNELIIIEQLPIITERLAALSKEIDTSIAEAIALECSEENKQLVKKTRTQLSKNFLELEERRKLVKKSIEEPYNQFNAVYKQCVADKYADADVKLKAKIDAVENEQKKRFNEGLHDYFTEYCMSQNIDFLKYSQCGIKIGVSDNLTNLKKQAKEFIDRISDDIALIDTQEHKPEILVEYKKTLNCSQAITSVKTRFEAIEREKQRQIEFEEKRKAEAEAAAKVQEVIQAQQPLEPPKTVIPDMPLEPGEPVKTLVFKVTAPISMLKELKKFLDDGGYRYE